MTIQLLADPMFYRNATSKSMKRAKKECLISFLVASINRTLDNLAGITGSLNRQVNANTNVVSQVSSLIRNTDLLVHHRVSPLIHRLRPISSLHMRPVLIAVFVGIILAGCRKEAPIETVPLMGGLPIPSSSPPAVVRLADAYVASQAGLMPQDKEGMREDFMHNFFHGFTMPGGTMSPSGHFGHLGGYDHEFFATTISKVDGR